MTFILNQSACKYRLSVAIEKKKKTYTALINESIVTELRINLITERIVSDTWSQTEIVYGGHIT